MTTTVDLEHLRDNLMFHLLKSSDVVRITHEGAVVGHFFPARPGRTETKRELPTRRRPTEAEKAAFEEAATLWQATLDAAGIAKDEVIAGFKRWRAEERQQSAK